MNTIISSLVVLGLLCFVEIRAWPSYALEGGLVTGEWAPPGPGDVRGPCPALNTLANHGFLPRNGQNITAANLTSALEEVLNISSVLANTLSDAAVHTDGTDGQLSLDQLDNHETIEHDASMTRLDFYFGDNHDLNQDLFEGLLASSTDGVVVTEDDFAAWQSHRQADSRLSNPTFTFGLKQETAACGEPALFLAVFGQYDQATETYNASIDHIKSVFGQEKLPEVWTTAKGEVTTLQVGALSLSIKNKWTKN
eukprot:TRINITY_DN851_c0_g1_i1.p1 TRINITY_DN851_c0_g1~~TRINITY_DN851_c0_g1_i1.p1  ORF type:complete len:261 (+),score=72.41 TRINITY_DN851_c0_g1_i1:27-785(+)